MRCFFHLNVRNAILTRRYVTELKVENNMECDKKNSETLAEKVDRLRELSRRDDAYLGEYLNAAAELNESIRRYNADDPRDQDGTESPRKHT